MKNILSSLLVLFAVNAFAQTSSETRTVGDFTGINIAAPLTVELTQGDANSVVLEGDANDTKNVITEVSNGVLKLTGNGDEVKAKITFRKLNTLEMSSASDTKSMNQINTDSLKVVGSGASDAKLIVQANSIHAVLSGACDLKFTGTTKDLNAVLSGASDLKAYDLTSDNVKVVTSGASSAHVTANVALEAAASGASDIHYQGNLQTKTVSASGSSSISARNSDSSTAKTDTTTIHIGDYNVNVTTNGDGDDERSDREKKANDKDFKFWEGLDLGVSGYLTPQNKVEMPAGLKYMDLNYAKSYVFGWNAFQKNIHIYRNNVNLGTGLGLTWYHYNFRNSYSLQPNMPMVTPVFDSVNYKHNRLNMCYVNVPLFLEFNTNNNDASNSFHIAAGVDFGYNVFNNKLKQKYELNGHDYKRKVKDDFNVNPFRYDATVRIGYGKFTIFGSYALSTLFEKGKGPEVYPVSAGISLNF